MTAQKRHSIHGARSVTMALGAIAMLGIAVAQSDAGNAAAATAAKGQAATLQAAPLAQAQWTPAPPSAPLSANERALAARIDAIGSAFNGDIGIAVKDVQTGFTTAYDGSTYFPQQSVSKFWVALTALDRSDRGLLNLDAPVTVRKQDLTLFHQPIAAEVGENGYTTTLNTLMFRALTQSDNTCNDFVLWKTGGPDAVRNFLANKGISGIRFGPGERLLQSRIAGMEWKPSYVGANFYAARNALPMSVRSAAFENYIRDPMDGAMPLGVVDALTRLKKGELLSPQSTRRLLDIMSNTKTGPQRLKGGLAPGWKLAHKTGTGQVLGGEQAGYNDIGIITGPDGRSYAIATFIRRTSAPLGERMGAMQNVVRAVIDYSGGQDANVTIARQAPVPKPAAPMTRQQAIAAAVQGLDEEGSE